MRRLYLFGQPELVDARGRIIRIRTRKWLHLLAYLCLRHEQPTPRGQLAGLFWPESDEARARYSLRQALYQLRIALNDDETQPQCLRTDRSSVCLKPGAPLWVDVEQFASHLHEAENAEGKAKTDLLERAAKLYRGDFLEDCYDDWCLDERERLRQRYLQLLEELVARYTRQGAHDRAIRTSQAALAEDQLQESIHRRLIALHYDQGDRSTAWQQYQSCERALRKELNTTPMPLTRELGDRVRRGDPLSADQRARADLPTEPAISPAREMVNHERHRVAVLPFTNIGQATDGDEFADGMTEELIATLSKISGLDVIAKTSVMRYFQTDRSMSEIGQELQVGSILEGTIRTTRDRLRLSVRLVNNLTETPLWTETYERLLVDLFAVQSEIAYEVAQQLDVQLLQGEQGRLDTKPTVDLEAYRLYLKGRQAWSKRTRDGLFHGLSLFQQARELDPSFALAYAGIADSYIALSVYHFLPPDEAFPEAKAAAQHALDLNDQLAEPYNSLAFTKWFDDWDWDEVGRLLQTSLTLKPSLAATRNWYAMYLMTSGHADQAIREIKRAQWLDPLSPVINMLVGYHLFMARRYQEGVRECQRLHDLDPPVAVHFPLGLNHVGLGAYAEAIDAFENALAANPHAVHAEAALGHACASAGDRDRARQILGELTHNTDEYQPPKYGLGILCTALEETEQALRWLEQAYEERDYFMVSINVDPRLDELRSKPRFQQLLHKMGMTA